MLRRLLFVGILSLLSTAVFANSSSVYHYTLKNGLQVYIKPNHRSPMVVCGLWYKVGGSDDPAGLTGISHALEHMMFAGTLRYPDGEFTQIIKAHGGEFNAFTGRDFTAYYEVLPSKFLNIALDLEADRMQHVVIDPARFQKEIQVVKEERRMRTENNPNAYTQERFNAAAFVASPYHHPIVGWMDDLNHMTAQDLKRFYYQWYAPNNAVLVIAGDVEPAQALSLVKSHFASIKSDERARVRPQASAVPLGERRIQVNLPAKLPVLMMAYNVPVITTAKQSWQPYALVVLAGILDDGESSRLQSRLVRGEKIAANINVAYNPFARLNELFRVTAIPTQSHNVRQLKAAILSQLQLLANKPVNEQELNRAKARFIAEHTFFQDSLLNQAMLIGALAGVGLPWQLNDDYINKINVVTPMQIQEAAKQYLISNHLTVAVLKPLPMTAGDEK
jgi:zinc protease